MNSPKFQQRDEFEAMIARDLRAWSSRAQAPSGGREALLRAAADQSRAATAPIPAQKLSLSQRLLRLATAAHARRRPRLPQSELRQWLFTQAMWHNLGIDRRAVRFVC